MKADARRRFSALRRHHRRRGALSHKGARVSHIRGPRMNYRLKYWLSTGRLSVRPFFVRIEVSWGQICQIWRQLYPRHRPLFQIDKTSAEGRVCGRSCWRFPIAYPVICQDQCYVCGASTRFRGRHYGEHRRSQRSKRLRWGSMSATISSEARLGKASFLRNYTCLTAAV